MNLEFGKKLLIADYLFLVVLIICAVIFKEIDFTTIIVAWITQIGISSTAYYWKAKNENRVKIPLKVIESLPEEIQDKLELTTIITSIIQSE